MKAVKVPVTCPNCGKSTTMPVKELRPGRSKRCTYCSSTIKFTGDDGRKIQKSLDDFEKTIKSLNRKITINF